jgi:dihydroflavonol-4-reductase
MTVLVTGATGFVGASVTRHLLADGEAVRVLVRASSDLRNIEGLEVERAIGDLTDPASLAAACKGCASVFHVAADYRLWARDPEAMLAANVEGSRNLIRAAMGAGAGRIVYTSSVAALGKTGTDEPADEQTPSTLADKIGIYKQSKFLAEQAVFKLIADDGAPVVIVNPSAPVGPRDIKPTPTGRMIVEAAAGRIPAFVDTGLNVVHVDDVAEGHMLAWKKGVIGEKYILGGENLTLAAVLAEIAAICGRKPPTIRLPRLALMPVAFFAETWTRLTGGDEPLVTLDQLRMTKKKMYYSSAKAERDLGYQARPVTEAFADAVSWFRENNYLD